MKKFKPIPKFKNIAQEANFWDKHDTTEYIDWSKAEKTIFSDLKPSTESISIRLPSSLLASIKTLANKKDVPYQSLMKMFLSERINQELFK